MYLNFPVLFSAKCEKKNKTNDNRNEDKKKNRKQINFNIRIEWHLEANTNHGDFLGGHVFWGKTVMFFWGAGQFSAA